MVVRLRLDTVPQKFVQIFGDPALHFGRGDIKLRVICRFAALYVASRRSTFVRRTKYACYASVAVKV